MYHLIVENEKGERLELTNNRNYDVLEVLGTSPAKANINTVKVSGFDGARFNSSAVETRNIVITLNIKHPIEQNRIALYDFFRTKRFVRIYYRNDRRDVYIDGYVESFENNPWTALQQPQISIICPNPFWLASSDTTVNFSQSIALFEFPFSIPAEGIEFSRFQTTATASVDVGEIETGGVIQFYAYSGAVQNPVFYNLTAQESFCVTYSMQQGDLITIDTRQGQKAVTLLRSGVKSNLLAYRTAESKWITFHPNENLLSVDAEEGAEHLACFLTLTRKYEGV